MAYDEHLADRVRRQLAERHLAFDEKRMMGGLCFMVNGKMCLGIAGDRLMVRTDPARYGEFLTLPGAAEMDFTGRPMRGFLFIAPEGVDDDDALADWVQRCLDYNPHAPMSRKRAKKN